MTAAFLSQLIKGTFDSKGQRYMKAYLKSIQNSCGRSLSKKRYGTV